MKKILVTGGAGFIGSHLVDKLIEKGNRVAVIDNLSTGKIENLNPEAVFYNVDICDPKIKEIFAKEKPERVFHLAAQIDVRNSVEDPINDAKTNILGSLNIIEGARINNVKKIIFASTGGVMYGNAKIIPTPESYPAQPQCPYGVGKLAVEYYLNYYHNVFALRYAALRLGNVYGPRQDKNGEAGVVAIFCAKMINKHNCVINGDGRQTRDYVYVKDVVEAILIVANDDNIGIYNIGTGIETNVNTIHSKIRAIIGGAQEAAHGPAKAGDHRRGSLDSSKAKKELAWEPKYSLEEGIKETTEWFLHSQKEIKSQ